MKKIIIVLAFGLLGCFEPGTTKQKPLDEQYLPDHLKGLKVDRVTIDDKGNAIYIATIEKKLVTIGYKNGKSQTSVGIIEKVIEIPVSSIVLENDSIIVCRKIKPE